MYRILVNKNFIFLIRDFFISIDNIKNDFIERMSKN
jgi:hypothetical protein